MRTGVSGSIPTGGKLFLLKLIYPSLRSNTKLTTLPTLCSTGKLDLALIGCTISGCKGVHSCDVCMVC